MQYLPDKNLFRFTIIGPETDIHDRLFYHSLFAMLQEAACLDADHNGFGADVMDRIPACWLLLRMKVIMEKIPRWKDVIYVKTWSCGFEKVFFNRDFDILDENLEVIGRATSVWLVAHQGDHRPMRPSTIPGMEIYACRQPSDRHVEKIFPTSEEERRGVTKLTRYADYSEIDRNMHVNNTRYLAWSADAYYANVSHEEPIMELSINYSSEVHPGEEVHMYCIPKNGSMQVDGYEAGSGRHVFSTLIGRNIP
ncbi:MAG: hypothetical protein IK020_01835 [Clostridiales bacterium]|nr:hypothetical protein [Clostridiales bacterium]